jgi:glutathione S-transferase
MRVAARGRARRSRARPPDSERAAPNSQRSAARATASMAAAEPTSDPYPSGGPPGRIVIYGNPTSRVCKVLWVCAELGLSVDSVPVWAERKSDWFTALNPKQAVPVVRDGDLLLHESNTVVQYLATKYGPEQVLTTTKVTHPDGTTLETTTTATKGGGGAGGLLPVGPEATAVASMWTEYAETTIAPTQNPVRRRAARGSRPAERLLPACCLPAPALTAACAAAGACLPLQPCAAVVWLLAAVLRQGAARSPRGHALPSRRARGEAAGLPIRRGAAAARAQTGQGLVLV